MSRPTEAPDLLVLPRHLVHVDTDDALLGLLVRLYEVHDTSWPSPAPVPRRADPARLQALAEAGSVILLDGDRFTVPAVEWNRQRQNEWHRQGGRARAAGAPREGGRFTSSHQQSPTGAGAAGGGDDSYGTVRGSPTGTNRHQHDGDGDGDGDDDKGIGLRSTREEPGPPATTTGPPHPMKNGKDGSDGSDWQAFNEAWRARRLPDLTRRQHEVLWGEGEDHGVIRDCPTLAATWVREAPPGRAPTVIAYVLAKYHELRKGAMQ